MSSPALEASVGNQSIQSTIATPTTDASRPIAIIRASGCLSPLIRGSCWGSAAGATGVWLSRSDSVTGTRVYWTRRSGGEPVGALPEGRRRPSVVAPERLCELRGLAVPDRRRDPRDRHRADSEQEGGALHPHPLELAPEAGLAALGEGS